MSQFAIQAARNVQSHFADFLFHPFDKGLKGMVTGFIDSIRRMIAEAAAAKILGAVLGGTGFASMAAGLFHAGGIVGASGLTRAVPAVAFAGAQHFQPGGIAGNEVPANLHRGKEVLTRNDPRHRYNTSGGVSVVQNFDFRGTGAEAEMRLRAAAKDIQNNTIAAIKGEINRGGWFARITGRR